MLRFKPGVAFTLAHIFTNLANWLKQLINTVNFKRHFRKKKYITWSRTRRRHVVNQVFQRRALGNERAIQRGVLLARHAVVDAGAAVADVDHQQERDADEADGPGDGRCQLHGAKARGRLSCKRASSEASAAGHRRRRPVSRSSAAAASSQRLPALKPTAREHLVCSHWSPCAITSPASIH